MGGRNESIFSFLSTEDVWGWALAVDQRLFFAGKELKNEANLFDYGVRNDDVIQVIVQPRPEKEPIRIKVSVQLCFG